MNHNVTQDVRGPLARIGRRVAARFDTEAALDDGRGIAQQFVTLAVGSNIMTFALPR